MVTRASMRVEAARRSINPFFPLFRSLKTNKADPDPKSKFAYSRAHSIGLS
jgi:hypothetical protein